MDAAAVSLVVSQEWVPFKAAPRGGLTVRRRNYGENFWSGFLGGGG